MARRHRDYRAEYERRIQRGLARGFSRSQARGHPRRQELGVRETAEVRGGEPSENTLERLREISLENRREGKEFHGLQDWFDMPFPDDFLDTLDRETRDYIFGY